MKNTMMITDDFGFARSSKSLDELHKGIDTLITAKPDIVAVDAASPDMTNFRGNCGTFVRGSNFDVLLDAGHDPFGIAMRRLSDAGMRVLANIRMNDHHGKLAYWTEWEQAHVAWSLGEDTGARDWKSIGRLRHMDYAVEEVREYRLDIISEILDRYEVDGIQLDFGRTAPFVSDPEAGNGRFVTEFIRRVRDMLNPISSAESYRTLGVLVPWDFDFCKAEGLELERWVEEGLVDYISPGEWYYADWNMPIAPWRELCAGTSCKLYPFMPGNVSPYQNFEHGEPTRLGAYHVLDGAMIRAIADNYRAQRCDGIAFYNFYTFEFGSLYPHLRTWIDIVKSGRLSRHFLYCRKLAYHPTERDAFDLGLAFARDELNTPGDEVGIEFRFAPGPRYAEAEFRLAFIDMAPGDEVEITVDGETIDPETITRTVETSKENVDETVTVVAFNVPTTELHSEIHTIAMKLVVCDDSRQVGIRAGEFEIRLPEASCACNNVECES